MRQVKSGYIKFMHQFTQIALNGLMPMFAKPAIYGLLGGILLQSATSPQAGLTVLIMPKLAEIIMLQIGRQALMIGAKPALLSATLPA